MLIHQDSSASLPSIYASLHFPPPQQCMHSMYPTSPHEAMYVPQPLLPRKTVNSPWHPPFMATSTPHFPCQERSNYTEISTEKDRLLLWHQHQGSCKSEAAAAAASGHCAGYGKGVLTSLLSVVLGIYPAQDLRTFCEPISAGV